MYDKSVVLRMLWGLQPNEQMRYTTRGKSSLWRCVIDKGTDEKYMGQCYEAYLETAYSFTANTPAEVADYLPQGAILEAWSLGNTQEEPEWERKKTDY